MILDKFDSGLLIQHLGSHIVENPLQLLHEANLDELRLLRLAKNNFLLFRLKTKLIAFGTYFGFLFLLLGSEVLVVHSQVLTYFLRQILHQNLALGWWLEL